MNFAVTTLRKVRAISTTLINAFFETLAPRHCELCGVHIGEMQRRFEFVCDPCIDSLPPAPYPDEMLNQLVKRFPGDELALSKAVALFQLSSRSPLFDLIHALKYKGRSRIGLEFGRELAQTMQALGMQDYDALVPTPLHRAKLRERGFNQAERICAGMSEVMRIPVQTNWITRTMYTQSQTTLSAGERTRNVAGAFAPTAAASAARSACILLVDDVLTTGSTLNSCAQTFLELGAKRIDCAALAAA